ncbi:MAG: OadG family transporter subunit [Sphaerochaetaceae bacterium]
MLQQLPREILLTQINNGIIIMLLGMGVVFVFLVLLVFSTKFLSLLVRKYLPDKSNASKPPFQGASAEAEGAQVAAAIVAAIARSPKH